MSFDRRSHPIRTSISLSKSMMNLPYAFNRPDDRQIVSLGHRLVGCKTFYWKIVFLHFQFYIVLFGWQKSVKPFSKMKGKLFSLSLLYTFFFPTTSLLSLSFSFIFLSFHHFPYMKPNNGKLILELCFPL